MLNHDTNTDILYVSVGQSVGSLGDAHGRPLGTTQPAWWIRVGTAYIALDQPTSTIWLAAQTPKTWNQLTQQAENAPQVLQELLDAQFMVELPASDILTQSALPNLRVMSWGIGLGQDSTHPSDFIVASLNGESAITCDYTSYMLWTFFDGQRTIYDVVECCATTLSERPDVLEKRIGSLLIAGLTTRVLSLDHALQKGESS